MSPAALKLEAFHLSRVASDVQAAEKRAAVAQAYADGLSEGLARQEDEQIRILHAGLDRLARALKDEDDRLARLRREVVGALTPILSQILDCLAPAARSQRLEAALGAELVRLAQQARPVTVSIACGPALRPMVEEGLARHGLSGIAIIEGDADRIAFSLEGGRIELDPAAVADSIRNLIAEIIEDDASWTH